MKETIRFRGLSLNKDEQSAQHGELALCGNVELHDGALRPYQIDGTLLAGGRPLKCTLTGTVGDMVISDTVTCELLYIHTTAAYTHYISIARSSRFNVTALCWSYENKTSNLLYNCQVGGIDKTVYTLDSGTTWLDAIDDSEVTPDATPEPSEPEEYLTTWVTDKIANFDASDIRDIKSVGNTLCIMCGDGLHYILCKNDSGWGYKYLGQHPPFMEITFDLGQDFDLINDPVKARVSNLGVDGDPFEHDGLIDEKCQSAYTDAVLAITNKAIDRCTDHGRFYAPFMVRYCYRLFDNSMIMHSAPVLLIPTLYHPVWIGDASDVAHTDYEDLYGLLNPCILRYSWVNDDIKDNLSDWKDIVKSVDFFVTPQSSRIDTSKTITRKVNNIIIKDELDKEMCFVYGHFYKVREHITGDHGFKVPELPEISESEYIEKIMNRSSFFKISSLPLQEGEIGIGVPTQTGISFYELPIESSVVKNIAVQEQMTDDYKTHNTLIPASEKYGNLYVYNHRLNVCGISEKLFDGFPPSTLFSYWKGESSGETDIQEGADTTLLVNAVYVWIDTAAGTKKVGVETGDFKANEWMLKHDYCFYPDDRAFCMQFDVTDPDTEETSTIFRKLKSSPELNGSCSFMPEEEYSPDITNWDGNTDAVIPLTNKVYTSRADNPFYFPNLPGESGINSVGVGNIIGIAAVTRPLVQGEVGRQNLVVFATDGIWVLEVSPTGTYQSMRNLSREVCVNKESICQMDQSILFATNRSLSRFVESDVVSLSEILDGPIFDVDAKMHAFYTYLGTEGVQALAAFRTPPLDFFREGRELYDYTGSRVLVFPKNIASGGVALMYSIRDGAWSTIMFPELMTVVNSYPSPYIERADGVVFRLDKAYDYYANTPAYFTKGVIITRTLTFSDTMDVLRGFRQYCDSQVKPLMFFYGSNDQRTWVYIGRSNREFSNYMPGHPYRFFRVAMVLQMYPSEEYQQLELEIVNKYAKL